MALRSLSNQEMVKHSGDLLRARSPARTKIEAIPAAAALIAPLQSAHDGLVAAQPADNSKVSALSAQLAGLDETHDELVRGIDARLASEIILADSPARRERFVRVRAALFPAGLTVVNLSYTEEAGEAELRDKRVSLEDRKLLAKLKVADGRSLEELFELLQRTARSIGEGETARLALGADGEVGGRVAAARNQWIRAVHALAAVLQLAGVDEAPILGAIRAAEAKADRAATPAVPEPTPPVDPAPAA